MATSTKLEALNSENTWNKVAKVSALFWAMKIVATTLGETLGDFLSMTLNLGYSTSLVITGVFFLLVFLVQLRLPRYIPISFWLVIVATTTLGTEISDFLDRSLHLGYTLGSLLLVTGLFFTLWLWKKRFGNLQVYPITQKNKEVYYWIAILFSNSLGTAFGDYLTDVAGLSYLYGALVTAGVIAVVILADKLTAINKVILFWIAFVFTRPFGATFGDFLTKPIAKGGLDLGTLNASLVALTVMGALIVMAHRQHTNSDISEA